VRRGGRWVSITEFSVEENVRDGVFRFAPPLIERSPRPKTLYLMWRAFQVVFADIADPRSFPPLSESPSPADLALYVRYVSAAEELAESQLLCGDDWMTITWDGESGEVQTEASFTSTEITRGFATLLRQFDARKESASFQVVSGRLRKAAAATTDGMADRRCGQIDAWRAAQGQLHAVELHRLGRRAVDPALEYGNDHPPTYYLSAYNYGELIHWGEKRDVVAQWGESDLDKHRQRMAFLDAATGLAYLYIGFSELVRTAIARV
jgi:hypothetical protein